MKKNQTPKLISVVLLGIGAASALLPATGLAQAFPTRPVRVVVPYSPGGSTDVVMRILAPRMSEFLGQPVVVENRPGGSSTIGLDIAAKAPPDGHTVGIPNIAFGANPTLFSKLPYDTEKDFAPVSHLTRVTLVMSVHPSVPARSVKEFIALAKRKPGALNFASAGNASANHLATERFASATGIKMTHIPYKGGGPAVVALVSGEADMLFATIPSSIQHFKSGKLRALGVSNLQRSVALPDVPSIAEAGVPGFEAIEWNGAVVASGTPRAAIDKLYQSMAKSLAIPDVRNRIITLGADPVGSTPEEFAAFIKREITVWRKIIQEVGIKIQ